MHPSCASATRRVPTPTKLHLRLGPRPFSLLLEWLSAVVFLISMIAPLHYHASQALPRCVCRSSQGILPTQLHPMIRSESTERQDRRRLMLSPMQSGSWAPAHIQLTVSSRHAFTQSILAPIRTKALQRHRLSMARQLWSGM